jgi:large subunit ribosomal protein L25
MPEQFIEIEVEPRPTTGKKSRRDAAEKGLIPGVVYGGGKDPVPIAVDPKKIIQILRSERGQNSILLFSLKGTKAQRHVMVKDFQVNPVSNELIHADFTRIMMDQKVRVDVPLVFEGMAMGVKNQGGLMDVIMREVAVESLPSDIPDRIHVDLSPLKIGDSVKISDLQVSDKVKIMEEDLSQPIVIIAAPRIEAAAEGEEEETEEEGQEPELIAKGKKAEEEGETDTEG